MNTFYESGLDINKIKELAAQGDAESQFLLGNAYYQGDFTPNGFTDYSQAEAWYRKAADQGHAFAEYSLGTMCYFGVAGRKRGEHVNYKEAAEWFCKAAKKILITSN